MKEVLLVAVDGTQQSLHAVDYAVRLAKSSGLTIELLNVQPKVNTHYAIKKIGKSKLQAYKKERAIEVLKLGRSRVEDGINLTVRWRQGIAAQEICKEAMEIGAMGIIIGMSKRKKLKGKLLGSTSFQVLESAHCPVTIVK